MYREGDNHDLVNLFLFACNVHINIQMSIQVLSYLISSRFVNYQYWNFIYIVMLVDKHSSRTLFSYN